MEVLDRVADDYEAIHTIRGDMERDLARPVSEEEVASAFLVLRWGPWIALFTMRQPQSIEELQWRLMLWKNFGF